MKDSRIRHKQVIPIVIAVAAIAAYMIVQQAGNVQAQNEIGNQYVTGCSGTCAISGPAVNQQIASGGCTTNVASAGSAAISGPANATSQASTGTGNQINLAGNSVPFQFQNSFNHLGQPGNSKQLSISIQSSKNIVNGKVTSTVTAVACDATTGKRIGNAVVKMKITLTSNDTTREIEGRNGEATYSAEIKPNSKDNSNISFMATVQAFAPGYISTSKTSSSSSTSIMTDNNSRQESIINNKASSNLAQNILKDVQKKLEQNGIDFSLGK